MANPSEKNTYTRISVPIPPAYIDFDDVSEGNIRILKGYTSEFISTNPNLFDTIARQLTKS